MTGEALFRVSTAYTPSQYRTYNRTVQRRNGVFRRVWAGVAVYAVLGAVIALALDVWPVFPAFVLIGLLNAYLNLRNLRRAEDAQYQQEQLVGTITYEFGEDSLDMTSAAGTVTYPYSSVGTVMENAGAFYIMTAKTSGAILPKEDCPADLEAFIRSRFDVVRVRDERSDRRTYYKFFKPKAW